MPEAGGARLAAPDTRTGRPARLGLGAAASLALHAGAAAAVAIVLAWRATTITPPPESPVQVVWLDARPPAEPDALSPVEPPRPLREAAPPAAPMGESATEGLEPEDLLATMLPDLVAPPSDASPATAEAPPLPLSDLMAAAGLLPPEPPAAPVGEGLAAPPPPRPAEEETAAREDRIAALAVPPPAPPSRAAPPSPARRAQPQRPRPPDAAAAPVRRSPSPGTPPPRAEVAAPAPAPAQAPLVQGPPRFRRPPSPPDYPAQARDRGEEGAVGLRLLVGADGTTREVRLHRSSGNRLFDEAALAAARRWEIEPASLDGRRAEAWVEVPVRFRLDR
jgi:periplasmic protein TonB